MNSQTLSICLRERYLCSSCCNLQFKSKTLLELVHNLSNQNKFKSRYESKLNGAWHQKAAILAYLCFWSSIFSRAFISTLSNPENILTQCLTLSLTENLIGNKDPHRTDSILSDLQKSSTNQIKFSANN